MSIDRRISLDLSMPDSQPSRLPSGAGERQSTYESPDPETCERFAAALAGDPSQEPESDAAVAPRFSMFIASPVGLHSRPPSEPMPLQGALAHSLAGTVEQLMVGDGRSGNRQVRIELKDEFLPGVSITVQELEGRLQVDFVCSVEDSRRRLNRVLHEFATSLAERLRRTVLLRVQTDDDEDPCLQEAQAGA